MSKYLAEIRPYFKQSLPKKKLVSRRIRVTAKYECLVTFWIPDIPYSKQPPGIGMTMRHGHGDKKEYIRLVFESSEDIKQFLTEFNQFVLDNITDLSKVLAEAYLEWEDLRIKAKNYKKEAEINVDKVNKVDNVLQ